jgi:hypothetical protein
MVAIIFCPSSGFSLIHLECAKSTHLSMLFVAVQAVIEPQQRPTGRRGYSHQQER